MSLQKEFYNRMKPQTGLWMGSLQIRGQIVNLPIRIQLDQAGDDGSLSGHFEFTSQSDDWIGPDNGRFSMGNYSQAGTLHFEQENVAKSLYSGQMFVFDGRFEMNDNADGFIWGSFTVAAAQKNSLGEQQGHSGTLTAAHLNNRQVFAARPTAWL